MYPESPRERIPKLAPRLQKLLRIKCSTFRKGSTGSKQATPLCPPNNTVFPTEERDCQQQVTPKEAQICCHPGDLLVSYSFRVIGQKFRVGVVNTKTLRGGSYGNGQF